MEVVRDTKRIGENIIGAMQSLSNNNLLTNVQSGSVSNTYSAKERKAIEIAKNLLDILDDEIISLKTGLALDQVKQLR